MASPSRTERFAITTPSSGRAALSTTSTTPGSRVFQSPPLSDETIWKRLKEAGFDEESIKRRDKAALIAYIAKLEAEIFDHQHHMGLLLLERKEWASKYEQLQASAESAEFQHRRDQAAHKSALAEAKKREDSLKKALGVEKECIADIEKTMHEMRAETAGTKVAAEIKLAEARTMVEDAQKKFTEAETKLHAAESLQAEATRYHRAAERKLQEVEAREDDLRRRIISFKSDSDAKENEIILERQALCERQKILQQGQERLLDGQALLNQREDHIFNKTQDLQRLEKELDAAKSDIENERRALHEEKSNLNLSLASLSTKEEDVIKKEVMLNKKEQELLVLQEKLASKEISEVQKLKADHETVVKRRMSEFEAELEMKRKLVEDDIEAKRRAWELREVDLRQREELILEREHDSEVQSRALADKENDMTEKLKSLEEKEKNLNAAEKEVELKTILLHKEQEEINYVKLDLQKSLNSLEDSRKQVDCAKENVEAMKSEINELLVLETKLKEEIDMVRAEKLELMAQADELKVEKAKFEAEWESIDEKREELQKEAECTAEERLAITTFLKEERDRLKLERDVMQEQYKQDVESLCRDREDFMKKMVEERSELFSKIQQEHADFLVDIEMQKRELENRIDKRREELERDFRERERAFEQEKTRELEYISSLKETVAKDSDYVASELKRLETERFEIKVDRERRDREWAEINNSIEELKLQRQKLKKQRELLHADRVDIHTQIEHLKKLELLEVSVDNVVAAEMQQSNMEPAQQNVSANTFLKQHTVTKNADMDSCKKADNVENGNGLVLHSMQRSASSSPSSARLSWIKRCAELIFKQSPEKSLAKHGETPPTPDNEKASLTLARQLDLSIGYGGQISNGNARTHSVFSVTQAGNPSGESKVILEVPSASKDVNRMYNLESEMKKDAKENFSNSSSEQGTLAGRKRRIANSSSNVLVDTLPEKGKITKKRRQQEVTTINLSEETITHCVVSMQGNEPEALPITQTEGVSEQDKVLIIDKIIKVSEVTCVNTDADKAVTQHDLDCLRSSIAELDHDSLQDGATNGPSNSSCVGNGGSKGLGMLREVPLADYQHFTEQREAQEDAIPEKITV